MDQTFLQAIPLLAGLSAEERADLSRTLVRRELAPHEPLFWVGDAGSDFYIVGSGHIAISCPDHSGREITLATLKAGDFLGEISLLDGGPRTATARAAGSGAASVLALGRDAFQQFIRRCPSAAVHVMAVLGRRQRETVDRLRGIRSLDEVMQDRATPWQKVANAIAALAGGQRFLLAHAICFGSWIALNLTMKKGAAPDPFPFPFLCFWASVEAIFLSLFIMISQNLQAQKDRVRTELDYQVAMKVQLEIMQLHQKMDRLPEELLARLATEPGCPQPGFSQSPHAEPVRVPA
jgi:uncharacterized membrane protein